MYKTMSELKKISRNLKKQGKTDEEIKIVIGIYLDQAKQRINPNQKDIPL